MHLNNLKAPVLNVLTLALDDMSGQLHVLTTLPLGGD